MENLREMMKKATQEQIEKIKDCKTAEEIIVVAKSEGFEITSEQAEELLKMLFPPNGEISDEELDNIAGGQNMHAPVVSCPHCEKGNCPLHGIFR
jgi:predicted ribosomally synthesized peptide with nif11-like leader